MVNQTKRAKVNIWPISVKLIFTIILPINSYFLMIYEGMY